jgi:acyl carrier protein
MGNEDSVALVLNKILSLKGQKISDYGEKIFESGLLDSFGIIELVFALEQQFQIKINTEDLTVQNFSSVIEISKLVTKIKSLDK